MKAIEILQDLLDYEQEESCKVEIRKALAELQKLTQEKSCDGCSHSPTTSDNCWHCIRGVKQDHYTPKG